MKFPLKIKKNRNFWTIIFHNSSTFDVIKSHSHNDCIQGMFKENDYAVTHLPVTKGNSLGKNTNHNLERTVNQLINVTRHTTSWTYCNSNTLKQQHVVWKVRCFIIHHLLIKGDIVKGAFRICLIVMTKRSIWRHCFCWDLRPEVYIC